MKAAVEDDATFRAQQTGPTGGVPRFIFQGPRRRATAWTSYLLAALLAGRVTSSSPGPVPITINPTGEPTRAERQTLGPNAWLAPAQSCTTIVVGYWLSFRPPPSSHTMTSSTLAP